MDEKIKGQKKETLHPMMILVVVVILCALATYILPAGVYDRSETEAGVEKLVDQSNFHYRVRNPATPFDVLKSVTLGLQRSADVIFYLIITGGMFGIVGSTGALNLAVARTMRHFKKREKIITIFLMLIFGLGSAFCGCFEEYLVFIPLALAFAITARYDSMTAVGIVYISAAVGYAGGITNAFTVGMAQSIAELPLFSGMRFRIAVFAVLIIVSIIYVVYYSTHVRNNPKMSLTYDIDSKTNQDKRIDLKNIPSLSKRQIVILIVFILGMIMSVIGVIHFGFYVDELSGVFILVGIVCGFVAGYSPSRICREFGRGCKDMLLPGMMIGLASAALIILEDANVLDSIMHSVVGLIVKLPEKLIPCGMFLFHLFFNVIVPSGSAQARATMPLMVSIADKYGIARQTAVIAYQMGDAFTNIMAPTGGEILAALMICRVPFTRWVRFLMPLFVIWVILGLIIVIVAGSIF